MSNQNVIAPPAGTPPNGETPAANGAHAPVAVAVAVPVQPAPIAAVPATSVPVATAQPVVAQAVALVGQAQVDSELFQRVVFGESASHFLDLSSIWFMSFPATSPSLDGHRAGMERDCNHHDPDHANPDLVYIV